MAVESLISWTDGTSNFWWGCTEVAPECDNCYAASFAKYTGKAKWGKDGTRTIIKGTEKDLVKLARQARESGHKKISFVSSMCDIFETDKTFEGTWIDHNKEAVDTSFDEQRQRAFDAMDRFTEIHFLCLTKRTQNILKLTPPNPNPVYQKDPRYRSNVSFGTSAGLQKTWNSKVPMLMRAAKIAPSLFVSCEPMMEPIDIRRHKGGLLPSVIFVGGESASREKVRPMDAVWAASIGEQVAGTDTIFHFKQFGSYATNDGEPMNLKHPKGEDPSEWPAKFLRQELPTHWRGDLTNSEVGIRNAE